jgi:hypothetical protein
MNRTVVKVDYHFSDAFLIPENINLEDKTQVADWYVKWNVLHIHFTNANGKVLKIKSQGWYDDDGFKYPSNDPEIVDADDLPCIDVDDEGFKEIEI